MTWADYLTYLRLGLLFGEMGVILPTLESYKYTVSLHGP